MRSPVSWRTLGECKAIRSRGFNHSELTFVGIVKSHSVASYKPSQRYAARTLQVHVDAGRKDETTTLLERCRSGVTWKASRSGRSTLIWR